jgi:hypothetical protein
VGHVLSFSEQLTMGLVSNIVPNSRPRCSNTNHKTCSGRLFATSIVVGKSVVPYMAWFCQSCHDRLQHKGATLISDFCFCFPIPQKLLTGDQIDTMELIYNRGLPTSWKSLVIDPNSKHASGLLMARTLRCILILDPCNRSPQEFNSSEACFLPDSFLKRFKMGRFGISKVHNLSR